MLVNSFLQDLGLGSPNNRRKLGVKSPELCDQLGEEAVAIPSTERTAIVDLKAKIEEVVKLATDFIEAW